jgi:hypothetical protein
VYKRLNTPQKIQNYLDKLPINFEKNGETYRSPQQVLNHGEAHCFEGALLALACLHLNGKKAFLLDLKTKNIKKDSDHVVTLFREKGRWGAISKTNHPCLRWRDPIYKSVEALAFSYFHEYFLDNGEKTLLSYSEPFDVIKKFGESWIGGEDELDGIALALDRSKHHRFYPLSLQKSLRRATKLEIEALGKTQFKLH